ncbi:hypothetical protein GCM10009097_55830 [Pigmentiphaga daeguensis]|uniref:Uncharacterized protein n=1 Tax=Pigmentiphaga daeguensis TaxID=414049 RepID=A0ABP3MZC9_9BURK
MRKIWMSPFRKGIQAGFHGHSQPPVYYKERAVKIFLDGVREGRWRKSAGYLTWDDLPLSIESGESHVD